MNLDCIKEKSPQEVFDFVAKHLLNQMSKSWSPKENVCLYRSGSLRCAAGCLISDAQYSRDIEGYGWDDLVKWGYAPEEHSQMIEKLQLVHDLTEPYEWRHHLQDLANEFDLGFCEDELLT